MIISVIKLRFSLAELLLEAFLYIFRNITSLFQGGVIDDAG